MMTQPRKKFLAKLAIALCLMAFMPHAEAVPARKAEFLCADGKDNDNDGKTDCGDSDCKKKPQCHDADHDHFTLKQDCDDTNALVYPGAPENCTDTLDNDCDGAADCADSACAAGADCATAGAETPETVETAETAATPRPFATMLGLNANSGFKASLGLGSVLTSKGWLAFSQDTANFTTYTNGLDTNNTAAAALMAQTGFDADREIAAYFTWNVIEPNQGAYDWSMPDKAVAAATSAGVTLVAVVQPFASWDQDSVPAGCNAIDFAYYDFKAGPPADWDAYKNFLTAAVKRYPGQISAWEIGNEYDGNCGGYAGDGAGYAELVRISSETIKATDPTATVLNGGALEADGVRSFWEAFFAAGGNAAIDAFNFHYNSERNGAAADTLDFTSLMDFFNAQMDAQGARKPLWLTEFGTYSGTPSNGSMTSPATLKEQSEAFQAAWYFRYCITAFANGVERIFLDLTGDDQTGVTASGIFKNDSTARTFLTTLKTLEANTWQFTDAQKIADGQYKFTVGGKTVYALWAGTLPSEISGNVTLTDDLGQEKSMDATAVTFSSDAPVFLRTE